MSFRTKILKFVEVMLRVPPLFLIDEILKVGVGLTDITEHDLSDFEHHTLVSPQFGTNYSHFIGYDPMFYKYLLISIIRLTLSTLGKFISISRT